MDMGEEFGQIEALHLLYSKSSRAVQLLCNAFGDVTSTQSNKSNRSPAHSSSPSHHTVHFSTGLASDKHPVGK